MAKCNKSILFSLILCAVVLLSGCGQKDYGNGFTQKPLTDRKYEIEEVVLECSDITKEYNLLVVADLHILQLNDEVADNAKDVVSLRINSFKKKGDKSSTTDRWSKLPDYLDESNADMILFAGDMVDFASEANISCLKEGLSKIDTPFLYVRADHDMFPYYLADESFEAYEKSVNLQKEVSLCNDVFYVDLGEIVVLAINKSTEQMTISGLEIVKEALNIGKPVVMLTHVPINSLIDDSLEDKSREVFDGRNLTWGLDTDYYHPDPTTKEFLELVYSPDSPIKEIVCGHLHIEWDGYITNNTHEHVYSPAFEGKIGVLRIKGSKS